MTESRYHPDKNDALLLVDVQNDFLPGGNLAVAGGNEIIPVLNRLLGIFRERSLPVYASRDWHPEGHCSFQARGGDWPPHCVRKTEGAAFAAGLALPPYTVVISKGTALESDAYSAFDKTPLDGLLKDQGIERLFVGGLATDVCVLNTVNDALTRGYRTLVLSDAIRAVNLRPGDGRQAVETMRAGGAEFITNSQIN